MNENVFSKLKYACIKWIIIFGFFGIIFSIISYRVLTGLEEMGIIGIIIILAITIFCNYSFIKNIICFINPHNNPIALKYGGIEKLEKLVKLINKTVIYSDKKVIVSKDYISYINSYKTIIHLDDVINAYQFIQRTNGFITAREVVIIDKSGKETHFGGYSDNEQAVINVLKALSQARDDIKIGFVR